MFPKGLPGPLQPTGTCRAHCSRGKAQEGEELGQEGTHTAQHLSPQWHPDSSAALPAAGRAAGSEGWPLSPICTESLFGSVRALGATGRVFVQAGSCGPPRSLRILPSPVPACLSEAGRSGRKRQERKAAMIKASCRRQIQQFWRLEGRLMRNYLQYSPPTVNKVSFKCSTHSHKHCLDIQVHEHSSSTASVVLTAVPLLRSAGRKSPS